MKTWLNRDVITLLAAVVLTTCAATLGCAQERCVLHFANDRSLGEIWVQDSRQHYKLIADALHGHFIDSREGLAWESLGPARGDVTVPPGRRVKLTIEGEAWQNLSPLARLATNDIYEIDLSGTDADDLVLAVLIKLTKLKALCLWGTAITDAGMATLAQLTSLEELVLPDTVTDQGLAALEGHPNLERLWPTGRTLSGAGLLHLRKIPKLRVLRLLGQRELQDVDMELLVALPNIESLDLCNCRQISDASVVFLLQCRSLSQLNLAATRVTAGGIASLASAQKLEGLDLVMLNPGPDDDALVALSRLPALKRLRLSNNGYTEEGVSALTNLERLELLDVGGSDVTDVALQHIAKFPRLRQLCISKSPIDNSGLATLGTLKSLEVLDLVNNQHLTVGGLAKLSSLSNLQFLYVRGAGIAEDGARLDISRLRSLTDLMLQFSTKRLRADHLACLKSLTKLRSLQLLATTVNDEALAHLRGLTNLCRLQIGGPKVTDAGVAHLSALGRLADLSLVGNISDTGLRHLERLSGLKSVQIKSSQDFSQAAIQRFRQALPGLKRLQLD